jgi:hypothetical protein
VHGISCNDNAFCGWTRRLYDGVVIFLQINCRLVVGIRGVSLCQPLRFLHWAATTLMSSSFPTKCVH